METASFSHGSILNTSEVAREAGIERKVVESYFHILEELMIGFRLPIFTKRAKRRLLAHPKFYFFDTGMYRAIRPLGPLDMPEMIEGAALEGLFFQELMATNDNLHLGYQLYYYRTATGAEVDFVAYGGKGIRAFEIKRSRRLSQSDLSGLKIFAKDYDIAKCFLIYGGKRRMKEGTIEIIPVEDALKNLSTLLS